MGACLGNAHFTNGRPDLLNSEVLTVIHKTKVQLFLPYENLKSFLKKPLKNRRKLTGLRTHRPRNPRPRIPSRPRPRRRQRPSRPPRTAGAATGTGGTSWECGGGRTERGSLLDRSEDRRRLTNSRTEEEAKSNIFLFLVRECFISVVESTLSLFLVGGKV